MADQNGLHLPPSSFWVEYRQRAEPFNMPLNHYHTSYEIYYLVSGERYYFIKEKTYHVIKGDFVLINYSELHKTSAVPGASSHERILIQFSPEHLEVLSNLIGNVDLLSCFHSDINVIRLDFKERSELERLLFRIVDECQKMDTDSLLYRNVLLIELLIVLNRQVIKAPIINPGVNDPSYEKIYPIVRYINEHYMEDVTLSSLSQRFYISIFHLSRTFKKVTGFSLVEYLNNVRTREAQNLLRNTKLNVTQITEQVGFGSLTHFERVFKSLTGLSPLKYRQSVLKKNG